ncbi:MAG: hypothetical protein EAZ06_07755 [Cytophagales bacterium]|nr:MAG: hypothetical protein EAZ06_07755 [Cytophagales bacterium]
MGAKNPKEESNHKTTPNYLPKHKQVPTLLVVELMERHGHQKEFLLAIQVWWFLMTQIFIGFVFR